MKGKKKPRRDRVTDLGSAVGVELKRLQAQNASAQSEIRDLQSNLSRAWAAIGKLDSTKTSVPSNAMRHANDLCAERSMNASKKVGELSERTALDVAVLHRRLGEITRSLEFYAKKIAALETRGTQGSGIVATDVCEMIKEPILSKIRELQKRVDLLDGPQEADAKPETEPDVPSALVEVQDHVRAALTILCRLRW